MSLVYAATLLELVPLDHCSYVSVLVIVKQNDVLYHQCEMLLFLLLQLVDTYPAIAEQ